MGVDGVGVGDVHGTGDGDDGDVCVWGESGLGLDWLGCAAGRVCGCVSGCGCVCGCVWICVFA